VALGRKVLIGVLAIAACLIAAAPAQASFHLIKVREVYPGPGDGTGFVELQMYETGQNKLEGHILTVYDADGELIHTAGFHEFVLNAANQSTILIGEANVATALRVTPDLVDPLNLPAAGGAVCWNSNGTPSDCVSWGDFNADRALSNSAGHPVDPGGIGPEEAILRKISPGCPTLLEPGDDTDDSATDFAILPNSPNPRNNATPPTEQLCPGMVPDTSIDEHPDARTNSRTATFTYGAPTATKFKCRLDSAPFGECPASGRTFMNVLDGTHTFQVRGENSSGADQSPAEFTWTVDTVAPTTIIDIHPADPSPGQSAAFSFHASEATLNFECSLTPQGAAASFSTCTSPKTFNNLADGNYTFEVRATDLAGNAQAAPTAFAWRVDNGVADTTPPETTITAMPFDPSLTRTAFFGYASNEPGSTFACSLDNAPFTACPASGITYNPLGNGVHTFRVRAIDPSNNIDQTPAAYTFTVIVVPHEELPPPVVPQTSLVGKSAKRTSDPTPTFRFRASVPGASFRCAVDRGRFKACRSPFTAPFLRPGGHTFRVKASVGGLADPTPLRVRFQILRRRTG
jgi:hypothetical protein